VTPQRHAIADAKRIVVKLGSAVLTGGGPRPDAAFIHDIVSELASARARGTQVIVVSSGAVAAGLGEMGLATRPHDVAALQAAAALGQPNLISLWRQAFALRDTRAAQMLFARTDFDSRDRFLNIRNCITHLIDHDAVPIVNENDSVATEEISLGDNDVLAAKLGVAARADALLLLTTARGVEDADGKVIDIAGSPSELEPLVRAGTSTQGRGGMATKIEAARIAGAAGIPTVIAPGRPASTLGRLLAGEPIGTLIAPKGSPHAGRRAWIATTATPLGDIAIDAGAARALRDGRASLLAKGITGVTGAFAPGDPVRLVCDGEEIARGLTNLSASETRQVMGTPTSEHESILGHQVHEEVVHRDNLTLSDG
jgi:glutamate 5-kinase